jgi:hypothetical protein
MKSSRRAFEVLPQRTGLLRSARGNADTYSSAVTIDPSRILRPCGGIRWGG